MLRIGVFTFTIQAVGQPTRYVTDIIYFYLFNIKLGYPSKLCIYFGHHDPSSGKPLGHFQVLICRNTKYNGLCIKRSQTWNKFSKYQATQACSMAWQINKVSAILLHEALKRLNSAIVFHSSHINRRPDQDSSSRWFDGCGSVGARTSSSLPSRWKSAVDQSILVKAWNMTSSWIRSEGLISGA